MGFRDPHYPLFGSSAHGDPACRDVGIRGPSAAGRRRARSEASTCSWRCPVSMSTPLAPLDSPDDEPVAPGTDATAADDPAPEPEVVVGVDGGDCALGAVRWAAREAVRRNAPLRILHVADYLGRPAVPGAPPPELRRARQITAAAYTVARHTDRAVQASTEIVPGDAADVLLE